MNPRNKGESPQELVSYVASFRELVPLYFMSPMDVPPDEICEPAVFVTFPSFFKKRIPRLGDNHFRICKNANIIKNMAFVLDLLLGQIPNLKVSVHFGWPLSNWFDRFFPLIRSFQLMRLAKRFPQIDMTMEHFKTD